MSAEISQWRVMLRQLMICLRREAAAIARRDFRSIADLAPQKQALADQLEALLGRAGPGARGSLAEALREIEEIARANAVQLKSFRDGVARARERIRDVSASHARVGVYEAQGRPLKARADSATGRSA